MLVKKNEKKRISNTNIFINFISAFIDEAEDVTNLELFLALMALAGDRSPEGLEHAADRNGRRDDDICSLEKIIYHLCQRNGIECSKPMKNKPMKPGLGFHQLMSFYYDHISNMSFDDFEDMENKWSEGKDISDYEPVGDWRNYKRHE